jgi:hypothetical protein
MPQPGESLNASQVELVSEWLLKQNIEAVTFLRYVSDLLVCDGVHHVIQQFRSSFESSVKCDIQTDAGNSGDESDDCNFPIT